MAIPAGLMKVDDTPANERCYAVDACLQSFVAHLKHGNTKRLQQRLWRWHNDLWRQKT